MSDRVWNSPMDIFHPHYGTGFVALCGANNVNQATTHLAENVDCEDCLRLMNERGIDIRSVLTARWRALERKGWSFAVRDWFDRDIEHKKLLVGKRGGNASLPYMFHVDIPFDAKEESQAIMFYEGNTP